MSQSSFVIGRFDWAKNRGGGGGNQALRLRTGRTGRAMGNVRGLPQVVFKVVPNGGCKGPMGLAAQLGYVLGKAEHIIDPSKEHDRLEHLPEHFSEAIAKDWADGWDRRVQSGHSMHMIASFPRGTDPEKVAEIMREGSRNFGALLELTVPSLREFENAELQAEFERLTQKMSRLD